MTVLVSILSTTKRRDRKRGEERRDKKKKKRDGETEAFGKHLIEMSIIGS